MPVPRIVTPDEVLFFKGKPLIIQPSWSVKPVSPTDNYKETLHKEYASQGFKLLLNRMKKEVIQPKKSISPMTVFIIIVVIIAIGYFAYSGGYLG